MRKIFAVPYIHNKNGVCYDFGKAIDGVSFRHFGFDPGFSTILAGANKSVPGHIKDSAFGYRAINRKKVGSDPTMMITGKGALTIRNMILVNNPWWGIYVKGGGTDKITIENNLILISQGRGI